MLIMPCNAIGHFVYHFLVFSVQWEWTQVSASTISVPLNVREVGWGADSGERFYYQRTIEYQESGVENEVR